MSADVISMVRTPHFCELPVSAIVVDGRHRIDLGDIHPLAESIKSIGLIQPIIVTPDNRLVAGQRRLEAFRLLGRDTIRVVVINTLVDATDRLLAERDENTCRKDFTASELVSIGRRLEELERPKAEERRLEGNSFGGRGGTGLSQGSTEPRLGKKTDQIVGEALGVSQSTYKRAKTVINATADANAEVAEVAREQLAKLDAGETSYSSADQAVRDARNGKKEAIDFNDPLIDADIAGPEAEPEVIPGLPTKIHGPRPNHLKVLSRVAVNLSGMVIALDDIEAINDTVNAEEALRISKDLSISIRALNRINKLLKERIK